MDAKESYNLTYPYLDVEAEYQKDLTDIIEQNFLFQELIEENYPHNNCSFGAIGYGLRWICESFGITLVKRRFVDCFGNGGCAAFYASSYGFSEVVSIEYSSSSFKHAESVLKTIHDKGIRCNVKLKEGSMQDYFSCDSDIIYFDCSTCIIDSMIDEGLLLDILFRLSKDLQAGSFLIVCTYGTSLSTEDLKAMGHGHLVCLNHTEVSYSKVVESELNEDIDSLDLWILKCIELQYSRK